MAIVKPFRALQFTPAAGEIEALTCPPYDIISEEQRAAFLRQNPHNVIRLELPREGENPYAVAAETLAAWQAEGKLKQYDVPAFYLYAIDFTVDGKEYYVEEYDDREFVTTKFYFDGDELKMLKVEDSSTHSIQYTYFDEIAFDVDDSFFKVPSTAFDLSPILTGLILSIISAA